MLRYLLVVLLLASTCQAEEIRGKVIKVIDGDTIEVLDDAKTAHRIRLNAIDAPERSQAFGEKSKDHLSELLISGECIVTWSKRDKFGRILGNVVAESRDVNRRMVKDGYAWHYTRFSDDSVLARDAHNAQASKIGLWADPHPVEPWKYRADKKAKK